MWYKYKEEFYKGPDLSFQWHKWKFGGESIIFFAEVRRRDEMQTAKWKIKVGWRIVNTKSWREKVKGRKD